MANYILLFGIIVIEVVSLYTFEDFLAPSCLVCESFLLAYVCSCFSSSLGGWPFDLQYETVFLIIGGLFVFFVGSFIAKQTKIKEKLKRSNKSLLL